MFYAPRGFLIDYTDSKLVKNVTMGLIALKPQDVVILLKIVALGNKEWMNYQLAKEDYTLLKYH